MRKILLIREAVSVLLAALLPVLLTLFVVRLAFTEPFLEFLYSKVDLPPDPMPYQLRLSIAKLGLESVLSDKGMENFKNSGLFNPREVKHMEDVKKLLDILFTLLYVGLPLWFWGLVFLKNYKDIGRVLFFGSLMLEVFVLFVLFLSLTNYDWLFEAFHNLVFDPYSWRFREGDMLLRVYPMDLWYKATIYSALAVFSINLLLQFMGFFMWRKSG
ncbi:MAG: TIGR01906 family membrane protein [Aquificaceae bacterium]|nr:TIGR01906 family membrane protein [Aquificaceae bacterium]